jgi:hypothetical protein
MEDVILYYITVVCAFGIVISFIDDFSVREKIWMPFAWPGFIMYGFWGIYKDCRNKSHEPRHTNKQDD